MPRFDCILALVGMAACHAEPAEVLFGLDARTGGTGSHVAAQSSADAGPISTQDSPLQVWIDVSDLTPPCGECTEITARASGGVAPYTFAWSDPTLDGPGPHRACPSMLVGYILVVTDARSTVSNAMVVLRCSAPMPAATSDGGSPGMSPDSTCFGRAPTELGQTCKADAIGLEMARSIALAQPVVPGVTYSALLGLQGLQSTLANGLSFRLYGGRSACAQEQLLGTFEFRASVNAYGACFVAEQPFDHVVAVTETGAISLTVLDGMAFCGVGCSAVGK